MGRNDMTSLERVLAVCNHKIPDRVPFILATREFSMKYAGFPLSKAFVEPDYYISAQLKTQRDFKLDAVYDLSGVPAVDEALGGRLIFPEDDAPYIDYHPFLNSMDELDKLHPVDPLKDGRMPYMLSLVAKLKKAAGPDLPVIAWVSQPFRTACMLRGEANLYRDLIRSPHKVIALLDFVYDMLLAYGKAVIDAGADIIGTSNPVANTDCISRKHYQKFSHPYSKKLLGALKEYGAKAIKFHTCGCWDDRLDLVCDENADIIHLDKVDLVKFKERFSEKVVASGNIHTSEIVLQGTPEQAEEAALQCLKEGKNGGRFILNANCNVPRDTNPDNIRAILRAHEKYGSY